MPDLSAVDAVERTHQEAALDGFWLPQSSTINWCEEDYYATIYSAEIVNTITNLLFMLLAAKGISNVLRNGHDRVFLVTFSGYALVGLGSFLFHATLKYPMQLVDELSMIYTTCVSCYASFSFRQSFTRSLYIGGFFLSLAVFITAYYHYIEDPTFHQHAYALLTATVVFRSIYMMETNLRPSLWRKRAGSMAQRKKTLLETSRQRALDQKNEVILATMWAMIASAVGVFLLGFAIWQLDNAYCSKLQMWRRELGLPWGVLLEGHGWWHIMTGLGAYIYIVWDIWLRHCLNGRQDEYELYWPSLAFTLPSVVKKQVPPGSDSVQYGTSKKES